LLKKNRKFTHNLSEGGVMKRKRLACCFLTAVLMLIFTTTGWGAVTGKISGLILDAENNSPLIGANVLIEGTTLGAATDQSGNYTIINIPPGVYSMRISMMGYQETLVEQVRVKIDLTTTIDIELSPRVIESGEVVTVIAERALVQRDQTSSIASVGAEDIANLPVQNLQDVLELQAGVVRSGSDFHIRGGRANEVSFLVDGVEVTDVYNGEDMGATVEKDAIQEMQLVSGTFNAEYGKAMSGIVSIITKEGSERYHGKLNAYVGDYISSDDVYSVLKSVSSEVDPVTGEIKEIEELENPLDNLNLRLDTDFSLSGPLPALGEKVSFFLNGRYTSNEGYLYGREWFLPQGLPGDSSLVPMTADNNYSGLGKLTYWVSPNLKVNYQVLYSKYHADRSWSRAYRYVPGGLRQNNSNSMTHMLSFTHTLSRNTFYELKLAGMSRQSKQYLYKDPTEMPHWKVLVAADTVTGMDAYELDLATQAGIDAFNQVKYNDQAYSLFIDPNDPDGYVDPDSTTVLTSFSGQHAGTVNSITDRTYGFYNAKFDLTSQMNRTNQVKFGFEAKYHDLELDDYGLIAKKIGDEEIIPFTPAIPSVESLSRDRYHFKPLEISSYIQDKLELHEMIINIGLRFDYFDSDADIPTDIRDPDIYNPYKNENIYKNWKEPEGNLSITEMEAYLATFEKYTPEERKSFMRKKASAKMQISPRIGIAYPFTDRGNIHFSYGHFLGMPGFQYLYNDSDYKLQSGGGNSLLGNPDLQPERTVHYEIGLQQQLGENIGVNLTLFYKDTRGWVGASPLYKTARPSVAFSKYVNKDYSNVYGLTLDLDKRFSRMFSARVYYSYQLAEGTYSNPNDAYDNVYNSTDPNEPRLALVPMNWDQRHTLNAFSTFNVKGWIMTVTVKYQSGRPYTPAIPKGEITGASSYVGWNENSERIPATSSVDLRLLKSFRLNKFNLNLYTVIYNIFDQRGSTGVFATTGSSDFDTNIYTDYGGYDPRRVGSYNEQFRRPEWYQPPREIQLGLSLEF
jgi:outer membrane receptor protein involved in Fe transport